MILVYKDTGHTVQKGDIVDFGEGDYVVQHFFKPHKPSSEGKVTVYRRFKDPFEYAREFYVSVIGAVWIDREDRQDPKRRYIE